MQSNNPTHNSQNNQNNQNNPNNKRRRPAADPHERRTLFIGNLPPDVTEREVKNLFAFATGFFKIQMYSGPTHGHGQSHSQHHNNNNNNSNTNDNSVKTENNNDSSTDTQGQPLAAFALFDTPNNALDARDRLDGYQFHTNHILTVNLALKNLFLTKDEERDLAIKQAHYFARRRAGITSDGAPTSVPPMAGYDHHRYPPSAAAPYPSYMVPGAAPTVGGVAPPYPPYGAYPAGAAAYPGAPIPPYGAVPTYPGYYDPANPASMAAAAPSPSGAASGSNSGADSSNAPSSNTSNQPTTTLFIARMDSFSNETILELLRNTFGKTLRDHKFIVDRQNQRICFVDFDSVESAIAAMNRMQGYQGLHVAFSKNPLGVRKPADK
jgi:RNA recognition motif-containing protein